MGGLLFFPFVSGFMVVAIVILIIYLVLRFILYIFQSFGLLRIAKKEGYKYPYIVWLPGISHYVLGRYCCLNKIKCIIYCFLTLVSIISLHIFWITSHDVLYPISKIYNIIYFIIDMIVMNKFYKKVYKTPELFTILTIITFGLLKPIFIYTARIKKITKVDF